MSINFPNVPQLPGVPQLARLALAVSVTLPLLSRQAAIPVFHASPAPVWGILDAVGNPVLVPDSFLAFGKRNEYDVSKYPVQKGGFSTFNKVFRPFEIPLRLSKGGTQSDREQFLNTLDDISGDTNLYTILTPEKTYPSVNITRSEIYRRGSSGAYFFAEVDISFIEIRQVTAQYSSTAMDTANAKDPDALPAVSQGLVQPGVVPPSSVAKIQNAIVQVAQ